MNVTEDIFILKWNLSLTKNHIFYLATWQDKINLLPPCPTSSELSLLLTQSKDWLAFFCQAFPQMWVNSWFLVVQTGLWFHRTCSSTELKCGYLTSIVWTFWVKRSPYSKFPLPFQPWKMAHSLTCVWTFQTVGFAFSLLSCISWGLYLLKL